MEKKKDKKKRLLTEKLGENRSQTRTDNLFMLKESYYLQGVSSPLCLLEPKVIIL